MIKAYSRYGIWIAIGLIAYFLILKLVGLHQYPAFSIANGLIYGFGLYKAMTFYKLNEPDYQYEKGFTVGLVTGGIATVIFTVFMAVFIFQIDKEFTANILESWSLSYDMGASSIIWSILIMGFATTLVLTLTFMQLLKKSWNAPGKRSNIM